MPEYVAPVPVSSWASWALFGTARLRGWACTSRHGRGWCRPSGHLCPGSWVSGSGSASRRRGGRSHPAAVLPRRGRRPRARTTVRSRATAPAPRDQELAQPSTPLPASLTARRTVAGSPVTASRSRMTSAAASAVVEPDPPAEAGELAVVAPCLEVPRRKPVGVGRDPGHCRLRRRGSSGRSGPVRRPACLHPLEHR